MRILFIHNNYLKSSGEENAAQGLANLLESFGHSVRWYRRSSSEIDELAFGKFRAFFMSLSNPQACKSVEKLVRDFKPDLVQVQNLFPLISPRILKCLKGNNLPIVMRCPNYRLFCPTGLFLDRKIKICERCTGTGRELNCIIKNCTGSHVKSFSYALRNAVARWTDVYRKYVDTFIVQSSFQKEKFTHLGIPADQISIVPGLTPSIVTSKKPIEPSYFSYVGRISQEKGINDIIYAAKMLPHIKFAIAGDVGTSFQHSLQLPNIYTMGFLKEAELDMLYQRSKAILVPSQWYEGFPNVITRAFCHKKPVVTTNVGCFTDVIKHGDNGLMYELGKPSEFVTLINLLNEQPELGRKIGESGYEKAKEVYGREKVYEVLIEVYIKTISRFDRCKF